MFMPPSPDNPDARPDDLDSYDVRLLAYRLREISTAVAEGFAANERRSSQTDLKLDLLTEEVSKLRIFKAQVVERERIRDQIGATVNARWIPIFTAIFGALVSVVVVLATT